MHTPIRGTRVPKYCSAQETRPQPRSLRAWSGDDHSARWRVDGRWHFPADRPVAEAADLAHEQTSRSRGAKSHAPSSRSLAMRAGGGARGTATHERRVGRALGGVKGRQTWVSRGSASGCDPGVVASSVCMYVLRARLFATRGKFSLRKSPQSQRANLPPPAARVRRSAALAPRANAGRERRRHGLQAWARRPNPKRSIGSQIYMYWRDGDS